jgi:hypothetical protein
MNVSPDTLQSVLVEMQLRRAQVLSAVSSRNKTLRLASSRPPIRPRPCVPAVRDWSQPTSRPGTRLCRGRRASTALRKGPDDGFLLHEAWRFHSRGSDRSATSSACKLDGTTSSTCAYAASISPHLRFSPAPYPCVSGSRLREKQVMVGFSECSSADLMAAV